MSKAAPAQQPPKDERTLLKVTLKGSSHENYGEETYEVCLVNAEGNREFKICLDTEKPAYFQLCQFMSSDPRKARQIHFSRGDLSGVMQGEFQVDEQTLKRDASVQLKPAMTFNDQGEEVVGPGETEEI